MLLWKCELLRAESVISINRGFTWNSVCPPVPYNSIWQGAEGSGSAAEDKMRIKFWWFTAAWRKMAEHKKYKEWNAENQIISLMEKSISDVFFLLMSEPHQRKGCTIDENTLMALNDQWMLWSRSLVMFLFRINRSLILQQEKMRIFPSTQVTWGCDMPQLPWCRLKPSLCVFWLRKAKTCMCTAVLQHELNIEHNLLYISKDKCNKLASSLHFGHGALCTLSEREGKIIK